MPEPPVLGRRSLVGMLLVYAALVVAVVLVSRLVACLEPPRDRPATNR
jgi:hypothetical protein